MKVILASASPRRKELLQLLEIPFEIIKSTVEEKITKTIPYEVVEELSEQKAMDVFMTVKKEMEDKNSLSEAFLVIGSDTVVAIDGMILGKPKDEEDAFQMLKRLSGKSHQVYTGVTLIKYDGEKQSKNVFHEKTEVVFQKMSDKEILDYIATKEPMDKAGSYGIQGFGAKFVKEIHGDYFNVVGLPVSRVYKELTFV